MAPSSIESLTKSLLAWPLPVYHLHPTPSWAYLTRCLWYYLSLCNSVSNTTRYMSLLTSASPCESSLPVPLLPWPHATQTLQHACTCHLRYSPSTRPNIIAYSLGHTKPLQYHCFSFRAQPLSLTMRLHCSMGSLGRVHPGWSLLLNK